jgi:hypothetical protein
MALLFLGKCMTSKLKYKLFTLSFWETMHHLISDVEAERAHQFLTEVGVAPMSSAMRYSTT